METPSVLQSFLDALSPHMVQPVMQMVKSRTISSMEDLLLLTPSEIMAKCPSLTKEDTYTLLSQSGKQTYPFSYTHTSKMTAHSRLSTGIPEFDTLLRGGLPKSGITELTGEAGCGKTQFAMQMALHALSKPECHVCWLSTEGDVPWKRWKQMSERFIEDAADLNDRFHTTKIETVPELCVCVATNT